MSSPSPGCAGDRGRRAGRPAGVPARRIEGCLPPGGRTSGRRGVHGGRRVWDRRPARDRGTNRGPWNDAWPAVHALDLSDLQEPGTYRVVLSGGVAASSPSFSVATTEDLFAPRIEDAVAFFQAQRDGAGRHPGRRSHRKPSHLNDRDLDVYAWPTYEDPDSDAIVGRCPRPDRRPRWTSRAAGSTPATTSSSPTPPRTPTACCIVAERELGARRRPTSLPRRAFGQRLARAGLGPADRDALHPGRDRLGQPGRHLQRRPRPVAAARGATTRSDRRENRYLRTGPAFRANDPGAPAPPNLAGRVAAAFALAAQVDAAPRPGAGPRASSTPARRSSPRAKTNARHRGRRRHRAAPRVLPGVVLARRHGAGAPPSWRWPARRSTTRAPARGCATARRWAAALHRQGGRRRHPQPLRHERAGARRPRPGDARRGRP